MLDRGRISSVQLMLLLIMLDGATGFFYAPSLVARTAGNSGWISLLVVASVFGLLVVLVSVALGRRFPDQAFPEYLPEVLGRSLGKLLAGSYALILLHLLAVIISESTIFIHVAFFRETSPWVLDLMVVTVVAYGVYLGIEVIARQNELVFPIWLFSLLVLLLLAAKDIRLDNLRPVLENGYLAVLKGSLVPVCWREEVFLLLFLYPYLNQKCEAAKTGAASVILVGVITTLTFLIPLGVFGDIYVSHQVFPINNLARYIRVADIVERLELYLIVVWIAGVVVKLSVFAHTCCIASSSALGLKNYRWTVIPVTFGALLLSEVLYSTNYVRLVGFLEKTWPWYGQVVEFLIPALVLLVAVIRKKGGGRSGAKKTRDQV
ncbi:MAG: endospore germination permease [Firmicutes bacterium]|nr:endospore germination permease [Bacillota bacterium]